MWVGGLVGCPALEALRADIRADTMRDMRGGGYQRVEVLTGPGRRRVWDEATQARVVAESYAPGAMVSAVAWRVSPGVDPGLLSVVLRAVRASGS